MRNSLLVAAVATVVSLCGCGADRPALNNTGASAPPATPAVARPQKPDKPTSEIQQTSLLDTLPNIEGDVTSGRVAARIRATVNGVPIFEEEVGSHASQFLLQLRGLPEPDYSQKRREVLKEALDQLVERELILQDASKKLRKGGPQALKKLKDGAAKEFDRRWVLAIKKNLGIKTDEQLKEFLTKQGMSLQNIRRQWVRQFMATEYLRGMIMHSVDKLGREQYLEYYEKHPDEFKVEDSIDWQDIFVSFRNPKYPTREAAVKAAEGLARRARAGEDFVELCKANDDGAARLSKAEGSGHRRGEVRPAEVEPYLFRMAEGAVGPVVEISSGLHVIKVVKRRYAGMKPFNDTEVQKDIRNKLRNEIFTREAKKMIADLRSLAVIEYAHRMH